MLQIRASRFVSWQISWRHNRSLCTYGLIFISFISSVLLCFMEVNFPDINFLLLHTFYERKRAKKPPKWPFSDQISVFEHTQKVKNFIFSQFLKSSLHTNPQKGPVKTPYTQKWQMHISQKLLQMTMFSSIFCFDFPNLKLCYSNIPPPPIEILTLGILMIHVRISTLNFKICFKYVHLDSFT